MQGNPRQGATVSNHKVLHTEEKFIGIKLRKSRVAYELGITGMRRGRCWSVRVPQYHTLGVAPSPAWVWAKRRSLGTNN